MKYLVDAFSPSRVFGIVQTDVVKTTVRKKRPHMTICAFCFPYENHQPLNSIRAQEFLRCCKVISYYSVHILVKRSRLRQDLSYVGCNRFSDICIDSVYVILVFRLHCLPEPDCRRITCTRTCLRRATLMVYFWQLTKNPLVFFLVFIGNEMRAKSARESMLNRAFKRVDCLGPKTILTSIPEEPGLVGNTDEWHGSSRSHTQPSC